MHPKNTLKRPPSPSKVRKFGGLDGTSNVAEKPIDCRNHVALSDVVRVIQKARSGIPERQQDMWATQLGIINGPPYFIDVNAGTQPIKQSPYRAGPQRRKLIDEHVVKMLATEFIELSQSEWALLIVIARKKGGNSGFYIDYRRLNDTTNPNDYPILRMDD